MAFPREVTIPSESYFPKKENFCKVTFMEVTSNHKIMIHRSLAGERDGGATKVTKRFIRVSTFLGDGHSAVDQKRESDQVIK